MTHCPICYTALENKTCSPCDDCGCITSTLEDLENGQKYTVYELKENLRLTLCYGCAIDFGSYKAEFLGGERIGFENFNFVKIIDAPQPIIDKYCPECNKRSSFLKFWTALNT